MQTRFPRRRPIVTRLPPPSTTVRVLPRRPLVFLGLPRLGRAMVVVTRPPRAGSQASRPIRPLVPLVRLSGPAPPLLVQQLGSAALRGRIVLIPTPPPGPLTRRFLRWARADTALARPARRDVLFPRGASSVMSLTSSLSWFRGEDVTVDFQMTPPIDVSGWTIAFTLKDTLGGATQSGFPLAASIVNGPAGRFRVAVASGLTAGLVVGRYVWDVRRTDAGNRTTLADGYLDLRQEVTS
jgi:hypothetical protein